jgi:hypothetical protein
MGKWGKVMLHVNSMKVYKRHWDTASCIHRVFQYVELVIWFMLQLLLCQKQQELLFRWVVPRSRLKPDIFQIHFRIATGSASTFVSNFFKICSLMFVCEIYRNLLLAGFNSAQRYNSVKSQQSTLLERCLLKVRHVSVWATIFEVEMNTNWLFLMCNIKCFVCNYISAVQLFMIRCTIL